MRDRVYEIHNKWVGWWCDFIRLKFVDLSVDIGLFWHYILAPFPSIPYSVVVFISPYFKIFPKQPLVVACGVGVCLCLVFFKMQRVVFLWYIPFLKLSSKQQRIFL